MKQPTDGPILSARGLTVVLHGDEGSDVTVLDGVSFGVAPGEVVDVTGPSGSGKTTLLRALARLLPRASGDLALRGVAATEFSPAEWRARVALLPQKPTLVPGCVRDNLLLPWKLKIRAEAALPDDASLRQTLDALGLADIALDRGAARLSVGQEARLAFARVWLTAPDVLLLDEADAALDADSSASMTEAVRRFAAGDGAASPAAAVAVVRVRHRESDGIATRRLRLAGGLLEEVPL